MAVGLTAAGAALALFVHEPNQDQATEAKRADTATASEPTPSTPTRHLPERAGLKPGSANLFGAPSPGRKTGPISARAEKPIAPPLPYRVAGKIRHGTDEQILVSRGDVLLPVKAGDMLDGAFYVLFVGTDRIDLLYLPLGTKSSMAITSTLDVMAKVTTVVSPSIEEPAYSLAPADEANPDPEKHE
jgi:hypothetical protein